MKSVKPLTILAAAALFAGTFAIAQGGLGGPGGGQGGGRGRGGPGGGAMLENLLPPPMLDELNLTTEQKAKYDEMQAAFKKEADAFRAARKAHIDKLRESLTAEQKDMLDKAQEQQRNRRGQGGQGGPGGGGPQGGGPGGNGSQGNRPPKPPAD